MDAHTNIPSILLLILCVQREREAGGSGSLHELPRRRAHLCAFPLPIYTHEANDIHPLTDRFVWPCVDLDSCSSPTADRQFRFGSLAALFVLETRLLARSKQAVLDSYGQLSRTISSGASDETVREQLIALNTSWDTLRRAPGRELVGAEQLAWLSAAMSDAAEDRVVWQFIGQQIIVQPRLPPDLRKAIEEAPSASMLPSTPVIPPMATSSK